MRPFCSKRCADIDLGKWLGEGYRVAGGFDTDDENLGDLGDFEGAEDAKKLH